MTGDAVIAALGIPAQARVGRRVPKKLVLEHGATTALDRRTINEGIEEITWVAALKPTTTGIAEYRDGVREYLEIAVLRAVLRTRTRVDRVPALVHRAVPYPALLIAELGTGCSVSVAHKRASQSDGAAVVLDGGVIATGTSQIGETEFLGAIGIATRPRASLYELYDSWSGAIVALQVAQVTGVWSTAASTRASAVLGELGRVDDEIRRVCKAAQRETQMARRVELNLALRTLRTTRRAMLEQLRS